MNARHLLTLHGEKIAVGVTALGCGLWVWNVAFDKTISPKGGVTVASVAERISKINGVVTETGVDLNLNTPLSYSAIISQREQRELPVAPRMGWTSQHPDVGPIIRNKPFFYVYEVPSVSVTATDKVGSIHLSINVPAPRRGVENKDGRLSDLMATTWTRTIGTTVVNRARRLAVQIDLRTGEGPWRPLAAPGILPGGILPMEQLLAKGGPMEILGLEPWAEHRFRARLVVAATGFDPANHAKTRASVLVHPEELVPLGQNGLSQIKALMEQWPEARDPELEKRLLKPFLTATQALRPEVAATMNLGDTQTFLGPQGPEAMVVATSDKRFALSRVTTSADGTGTSVARILISRQFRSPTNPTVSAWLAQPHSFNVGIGKPLGDSVKGKYPELIEPDGLTRNIDLTTPFVVQDIKKGVDRTWYYEVILRSRQGGGKGRDLFVVPYVRKTDVVTLNNPSTGASFDIVRLDQISKASKSVNDRLGRATVYPAVFAFDYNEPEVFTRAPADFSTYGLVPPAPALHKSDGGPLLALKKAGNTIAFTDTDYVEMPDGRLIWWYPLEGKIEQWVPPGFVFPKEASTSPIVPPGGAPVAPTGTADPKTETKPGAQP